MDQCNLTQVTLIVLAASGVLVIIVTLVIHWLDRPDEYERAALGRQNRERIAEIVREGIRGQADAKRRAAGWATRIRVMRLAHEAIRADQLMIALPDGAQDKICFRYAVRDLCNERVSDVMSRAEHYELAGGDGRPVGQLELELCAALLNVCDLWRRPDTGQWYLRVPAANSRETPEKGGE